jgi:hypothetical protein
MAGFSDANLTLLILVELLLETPARYWSGTGTLVYDGKSWFGAGNMGGISEIEETAQLTASGIQLSLSGIDSFSASQLNFESFRSKTCNVWLGYADADLTNIQTVPIYSGLVDTVESTDDGKLSSILLSVESKVLDFKRIRKRMRTNEDQQQVYPGDKSLEYILKLQNKNQKWGPQ